MSAKKNKNKKKAKHFRVVIKSLTGHSPYVNSFLLGGAATVLPFGKLYGLFDAKWLYITSSIVFNVGSAVCGAAPNMNALIIGRVLAGIGGNGMFMGVMNLMSGMTTPAERPGYLSFV